MAAEKSVRPEVTALPQYADWVREFCASSDHAFVRDSAKMISYCFQLEQRLPSRYEWRFCDEKALAERLRSARSSSEINRIYWIDQARNVEAYAVMTFWRGAELLRPAIRGLNVREVVAPAVVARSLLELATAFILNANVIEATLTEVRFPEGQIVASQDLEDRVIRMIYGTRLGEPAPRAKQSNILTSIQKLSRNPNASELLPIYEYLCEVAHPNVIGNIRFWSHLERIDADGSELRLLSKDADQGGATQIVEKVIWSLGWSAVCLRNAFEMTRQALANMLKELGCRPEDALGI